jgi:hypothetical protein
MPLSLLGSLQVHDSIGRGSCLQHYLSWEPTSSTSFTLRIAVTVRGVATTLSPNDSLPFQQPDSSSGRRWVIHSAPPVAPAMLPRRAVAQ